MILAHSCRRIIYVLNVYRILRVIFRIWIFGVCCWRKNMALMKNGKCASCKPGQHYGMYNLEYYKCSSDAYTPKPNVLSSCLDCENSSFWFEGSDSCTRSKYGSTLLESGECGKCPAGAHLTYRLKCRNCDINYYNPEGIVDYCLRCSRGTYALRDFILLFLLKGSITSCRG